MAVEWANGQKLDVDGLDLPANLSDCYGHASISIPAGFNFDHPNSSTYRGYLIDLTREDLDGAEIAVVYKDGKEVARFEPDETGIEAEHLAEDWVDEQLDLSGILND